MQTPSTTAAGKSRQRTAAARPDSSSFDAEALRPTVTKLKDGREHLAFANGDTFTGEKQKDLQHSPHDFTHAQFTPTGSGKYVVHATGDVFEGTFKQGKLVGEGSVTLRNGDVINARWRRDSTAEGTITYSNGSLYTGSLLSNRPDGYGVMEYIPRGARYDGQWQHGRPHGAGTLTFPNGDFVQGTTAC